MAILFLCVMQSYLMLETQSSFLHQTTSIVEVILMISVTFTKRKLSLQADNSAWRNHSHNLRKRKSSYFMGIWTSVSGGIQKWWKNLSLFLGWGPKSKISKRHTLNTGEEITLCSSDGTRYSPKWRKDEARRKKNGRILRCLKMGFVWYMWLLKWQGRQNADEGTRFGGQQRRWAGRSRTGKTITRHRAEIPLLFTKRIADGKRRQLKCCYKEVTISSHSLLQTHHALPQNKSSWEIGSL